jgi:dienelactone hydrolase
MQHAPWALVLATLFVCGTMARGAIKTEVVEYKDGDTVLQGYLAYDDAVPGKRPGVVVFHEWWGHGAYERKRAEQLAGLGYVALAADMYGKGVMAANAEEAQKLATPFYKDRAMLRTRAALALDLLKRRPQTDATKIAAIGYCFGGTTALELARSGAEMAGVVSFHGGLATPNPADAKNIKARILVLTGGDDASVGPEQVSAFQDEMRKAGVNWEVDAYGGAVHAFTNPAADSHHIKNVAYDAQADRRSWERMQGFLAEIFK